MGMGVEKMYFKMGTLFNDLLKIYAHIEKVNNDL